MSFKMLAAKTFCRKKTFKEVYIDLIKKVQRRFTKRLRALKDLSYTERLLRLNILSLELRRLQLDLIFCHKFVFGRICTNFDVFFTFSPSPQTTGHPYQLYKSRDVHMRFVATFSSKESLMSGTIYRLHLILLLCQPLRVH